MTPTVYAWYRSTFGHAVVSAVVLYAAFPPLDLWPLAWVAPVWWVLLIRRKKLDGRYPYGGLYVVGFLFWLLTTHFLRLPHWSTCIAWVALAFYFGFYVPVFVGLSRAAVHRLGVPVTAAAPVVWTGLELLREYVLTGSTIASLAHTQYRFVHLIQLSDLAGAYGVSFLVMFVAACLARTVPLKGNPLAWWPLLPAAALVAAALVYGCVRTWGESNLPGARVALIQECIDSDMKTDEAEQYEIQHRYWRLSEQTVRDHGKVDLVVWPETMFRYPVDETAEVSDEFKLNARYTRREMIRLAERLDASLILGVDTLHRGPERDEFFNSAQFVTRSAQPPCDYGLADRYDKLHLVLFGEYVPLVRRFPWLQVLTPMSVSLSPGRRPAAFELGPLRLAPNICFESLLPRVIRRQVNTLKAEGREPNVLVNLTNDGWFYGSNELDLHLACGVFRAVECRKPFLIAANTGFSAWIDAEGKIRRQGKRHAVDVVLAEVQPDQRNSWYLEHGEWLSGTCLAACLVFAAGGVWCRISGADRRRDDG